MHRMIGGLFQSIYDSSFNASRDTADKRPSIRYVNDSVTLYWPVLTLLCDDMLTLMCGGGIVKRVVISQCSLDTFKRYTFPQNDAAFKDTYQRYWSHEYFNINTVTPVLFYLICLPSAHLSLHPHTGQYNVTAPHQSSSSPLFIPPPQRTSSEREIIRPALVATAFKTYIYARNIRALILLRKTICLYTICVTFTIPL